jgi:hypothetical protein
VKEFNLSGGTAMRAVITETGVDKLGLDNPGALPASAGFWSKMVKMADKLKPSNFKKKLLSSMLGHSKAYRRDSFFFEEGLGYIPQRALRRHSAFLVYQKRYYQSIEQSRLKH